MGCVILDEEHDARPYPHRSKHCNGKRRKTGGLVSFQVQELVSDSQSPTINTNPYSIIGAGALDSPVIGILRS